MFPAYIVIAVIICITVTIVGAIALFDDINDKNDFKLLVSAMSIGYVAAVIWPLVIPLAILSLVGYGLWNVPHLIRSIKES